MADSARPRSWSPTTAPRWSISTPRWLLRRRTGSRSTSRTFSLRPRGSSEKNGPSTPRYAGSERNARGGDTRDAARVLTRDTRHAVKHKELGQRMKKLRELSRDRDRHRGSDPGGAAPGQRHEPRHGHRHALRAGRATRRGGDPIGDVGHDRPRPWSWAVLAFILSLATTSDIDRVAGARCPNAAVADDGRGRVGDVVLEPRHPERRRDRDADPLPAKQGVPIASAVAAGGFLSGFIDAGRVGRRSSWSRSPSRRQCTRDRSRRAGSRR